MKNESMKTQGEIRKAVFVTLRPSEREIVAELAEDEGRSLSSQIRVMVLESISRREAQAAMR